MVEIIKCVAQQEGISRSELARLTGVSVMTVSNIMEILLSNGVVYEVEQKTDNVGRNPSLVHFSPQKWMMVLELSDYALGCTILGLGLQKKASFKHLYDWKLDYSANFEAFLTDVEASVAEYGLDRREQFGVSVCLPSAYSPETDRTLCERLPGLSDLHIHENIRRHFDCLCWAEEDVKLAALAAASVLCPAAPGLLLYIYVGSGVGGAVVDDGKVFYGTDGCAGDIGQMELRDGRRLEDLVSWEQFRARLAAFGVEPEKLSEEELSLLWNGEGPASELLRQYAGDLGWAVYNACCLYSPQSVLLEGGCRALGRELIRRVEQYIYQRLNPDTRHRPPVLLLDTDVAGAVLGAGMLLREHWVKSL